MPGLSFEMPHWLYWLVLAGFPLLAMYLARKAKRTHVSDRGFELPLAYFILVVGGFVGLHRFYLKNLLGLLYIPLFVLILAANAQQREAREAVSDVIATVERAEEDIRRNTDTIAKAETDIPALQAAVAEAEAGSFARRSAERRLNKQETRLENARVRLASATAALAQTGPDAVVAARAHQQMWDSVALYALIVIAVFMLFDAVSMRELKAKAEAKLAAEREQQAHAAHLIDEKDIAELEEYEARENKDDADFVSTGRTGAIDRLCLYVGEYVAYWAVIAVFVYYYEVVARYVFNSPSNWAHEAMFLMLGMQYLLCGAYAMLTKTHVRVDIFYANFSPRRKAVVDLITSVFFFIFAATLMVTGWIFAMDATEVAEISFSEWAIAYWPFKWAIFTGALLLVLQGISKFAKDIATLKTGEA